ncbi:MAG TPA: PQQ-dependent dehydrogenase, methanol/ethanol family [Amycolatopsis sp.]|uniref:PQQ-dependent dehydrogenase, methanol/ethanol family n=1 Tax=Amycolatopsis sp. TaxID=37632 RepID=UPI002B46AC4E|nr:PQQ-dependent dehydrogenase, methanol/ethanol family [Amycolatopsis sp.]HKS49991.1 PQQ-dependent dehydrogenase, methanol/ethanol family [Amycolatopsis sp.]
MPEYVETRPVNFSELSAVAGSAPAVAENVTYDRILRAREEPHNWLTYYGAYDGQRYSPLDQINADNIRRLVPAWVFQFGAAGLHAGPSTYAFEAAPIVVDGVMYVSGWDGWVWALNARNGETLWVYKHAVPFDTSLCCGNVNRGVAVANGKVFVVTLNAHLLALDATTGKAVWDSTYGDVRAGESATVAPLVVKNLVIVGSSGGEFGVRGHLDAFDMDTGERAWRLYTVPKPGEPGADTWPAEGEAWARGGGNTWVTSSFDPETNLLYVGTGNPGPDFDGEIRPGDNLYTDSVIAVDVDSGQLRWHYQCTPHDLWDYDSTMECILFDQGDQKLLAHFDKNGYCFILDRTNGQLVRVFPFGERITWGEITADGKVTPKIYPEKEGDPVHFWPGPAGAKEWTHASYSPRTELFYVPVQDVGAEVTRRRRQFKESIPYWGASVVVDAADMAGFLKAFDAQGNEAWRWEASWPLSASTLVTGGDVVFVGEPAGEFNAFHARTGEQLWRFQTGSGHHSSPTTYSVDGRQFVAVPVGWGAWVEGFAPGMLGGQHGDALFAFALPEE